MSKILLAQLCVVRMREDKKVDMMWRGQPDGRAIVDLEGGRERAEGGRERGVVVPLAGVGETV